MNIVFNLNYYPLEGVEIKNTNCLTIGYKPKDYFIRLYNNVKPVNKAFGVIDRNFDFYVIGSNLLEIYNFLEQTNSKKEFELEIINGVIYKAAVNTYRF